MTDTEIATDNALARAAQDGGLDAFEAAWLEHMGDPPEASFFLAALDVLPDAHRRDVVGSLLQLLLEAYTERGRHADALDVVAALVPHRPKRLDLEGIAAQAIEQQYGSEPWYEMFMELSGMRTEPLEDGLECFMRLRSLLPGCPVYHATGWGEGVVTEIDVEERQLGVRFRREGRERTMPFTTGLDVLRILDADDLRARILTDAEGLAEDAAERPSHLVRAVCRLHKGRATAKEVKQWLVPDVIGSSAWNSWWRKAKVAAAQDPYLAVDNPSRPVFVLRARALSPEEEVAGAMARASSLAQLLDVVRGPLSLDPAEAVKDAMLSTLETRCEEGTDPAARAEAVVLLAQHERMSKEEAGAAIASLLGGPLTLPALMNALPSAAVRRDVLELFCTHEPRLWSDAIIDDLASLPGNLLDSVADRLVAEGRGDALANRFHIFLLAPSRQPEAVLRLAKRWGAGLFDGIDRAPGPSEVFMGVLHLAETQAPWAERGRKDAKAVMKSVADVLLARRRGLLRRFVEVASRAEMERAMGVVRRCKAMPDEIGNPLLAACKERFPDLVPRDETPFWESNNIFCSREGLRRRQEELRVLLEEKIPENSDAIGRAASFGDLSENFEWQSAIDQQRQLTEKAAAMEAELKLSRSIEDQELEEGVVAPGTAVTFEVDGETRRHVILGPWDRGDGVVSYRAPIAEGMLGSRTGEQATLELPTGAVTATIKSVEKAL